MLQRLLLLFCAFSSVACQTCPVPPNPPDCIQITSWDQFANTIRGRQSEVVFCRFSITKSSSSPLLIDHTTTIMCQEEGACIIDHLSTNYGRRFFKIRGSNAKVIISGFVFKNAGDRSISSNILTSAIHIGFLAGNGAKQLFCSCDFIGNEGNIRGVALRAEPKTNVVLVKCKFRANVAGSLGTIFNRGTMTIDRCEFSENSGRGGAIGSASNSKTILIQNIFINNEGDSPVFFHASDDYEDKGGNSANGNDCNGAFIEKANKPCITFDDSTTIIPPTTSPTPVKEPTKAPSPPVKEPSKAPSPPVKEPTKAPSPPPIPLIGDNAPPSESSISCERKPTGWCTDIEDSFKTLKNNIENRAGVIVFCEFNVEMSATDEFIFVTSDIELICNTPHKCQIKGPGRHLVIKGSSSKAFVQGFVFKGSTVGAVHVQEGTSHVQSFCNNIFDSNVGGERGLGIRTERNTITEVSNCRFKQNESTDLGGGIFNRGAMLVKNSAFFGNIGRGGCIGTAALAITQLKSNKFYNNKGGDPIFFHTMSLKDLGGNMLNNNNGCNCCDGALIQREGGICVSLGSADPTAVPPPTSTSIAQPPSIPNYAAPRGGTGYFNYDPADDDYGPESWNEVTNNPEYKRYKELSETLQRPLLNKCTNSQTNQSPIDLCENELNGECVEHHQSRTHSGDVKFGEQAEFQILPSKLRLKYYPDRTPPGGPYPPEADFANHWNGFIEVNHIDVKIPSEHTICGKRYPAELSIFMLHPLRRQTIVMSILMDIDPSGYTNNHFQKAIDEWQNVFDKNDVKCNQENQKARRIFSSDLSPTEPSYLHDDLLITNKTPAFEVLNSTHRNLRDTTPYGRGGWDPFHPSIERSLYHWGYWGSLTEPPCGTFVAWRVLTEPALISEQQWHQLRTLLFTNRDENCVHTSVANELSVARPTQPLRGRKLYKCTVSDYVSDIEKKKMKEETGNPDWCC